GLRTGSGDAVMDEIARRGEQAVADETDALLARVEPAIVIVMVLLVAVILVSVMLPLTSVMATL
ncbi:MAG: type II secretion system F family protein, partial [Clostridia bacterium]|nr:type II secretion system F family protein [Clostridia bacterium]